MKQWNKKNKKQDRSIQKLTSSQDLITAVKQQNYNKVKELIKHGANVNSFEFAPNSTRSTPQQASLLHIACTLADLQMVKLLLDLGTDVDALDESGMTPLYCAVRKGCVEVCECLIKAGADFEHRDPQLRTPLYYASSLRCYNIIDYLLDKGADVNAKTRLGRTALIKACWNGQLETVRHLLSSPKVTSHNP
eukprot:TRINITY_DN12470_c0_g3_i1.p2 TRINITY_DN12470_c0_g3~~TRINITY_DN12470_c0_g3_i1.p2  ORF type:complete len:192 (-),score=30.99 TRINITY_DN12470_c0_g3_i1:33-608(-)